MFTVEDIRYFFPLSNIVCFEENINSKKNKTTNEMLGFRATEK